MSLHRAPGSWFPTWLTLATALTTAAQVGAQAEPQVDLGWSADAACPPPADARDKIAHLIGERHGTVPPTRFEVQVTQQPAQPNDTSSPGVEAGGSAREQKYELKLWRSDQPLASARVLQLGSCAEVEEAVVLLTATSLAPELAPPQAKPEDEEEPPAAPEDEKEPAHVVPAAGFRAELDAMLDGWSLPGVSAGPSLGLSFTRGPWRAGVYGRYLAPRQVALGPAAEGEARIDLIAGAVELRYRWQRGRLAWGPATELELGGLRGRSPEQVDGVTASTLWASLWGGLALGIYLNSRVELGVRSLFGWILRRPQFALEGTPAFYTTAPVSLRLFLGLSIALGPTE